VSLFVQEGRWQCIILGCGQGPGASKGTPRQRKMRHGNPRGGGEQKQKLGDKIYLFAWREIVDLAVF